MMRPSAREKAELEVEATEAQSLAGLDGVAPLSDERRLSGFARADDLSSSPRGRAATGSIL